MNRLYHLRETLPSNLKDNADYHNLEFILLDYNSSDGLENWVKTNLKQFINSGRLTYYRTTERQYFHRSHSRNMAFKLATGDIVCNIDADNFTGKGFAHYINNEFTLNNGIFIAADTLNRFYFIRDVCGRICFRKRDFEAVGGFDEQMEGYGDEDIDFINRLQRLGRQEVIIFNTDYLRAILHSDLERVQHEYAIANLKAIYVSHLTPDSSHILFLFVNNNLYSGTLIDKVVQNSEFPPAIDMTATPPLSPNDRYALSENKWINGSWRCDKNNFYFSSDNDDIEKVYHYDADRLIPQESGSSRFFFRVTDQAMIIEAINFYSRMKNMTKLNENKISKLFSMNEIQIGKGSVIKNFQPDITLNV